MPVFINPLFWALSLRKSKYEGKKYSNVKLSTPIIISEMYTPNLIEIKFLWKKSCLKIKLTRSILQTCNTGMFISLLLNTTLNLTAQRNAQKKHSIKAEKFLKCQKTIR